MARIADIKFSFQDYPDPEKSCILVYLSGCSHNCPSCHNKELQNSSAGIITTALELINYLYALSEKFKTKSVVFQGGDPLFGANVEFIKEFIGLNKLINKKYEICIYTGYNLEYSKSFFEKGEINYFKCGLYKEELHRESKKTNEEFILSSSNQEFYNTNFKKISKKGILKFKN